MNLNQIYTRRGVKRKFISLKASEARQARSANAGGLVELRAYRRSRLSTRSVWQALNPYAAVLRSAYLLE